MKSKYLAALLAGSALMISAPAFAAQQTEATQSEQPDQSDAAADATIAQSGQVDEAAAKIELLQAQVDSLQASIEQLKGQLVKTTPTWKGAPQYDDKEAGFGFKPKGLIQWDAGYNGFPRGNELRGTVGGLNFQNLGWNTRARRLTIGADGTLPGGFRYSAEFNFAQAQVDFEDVFIAYDFQHAPVTAQIGYFYPFSSLETMTSSKYTSFLERAGFTDAFNYNRRLGIALLANDKKNDSWIFQGGIFSETQNQVGGVFTRTGWQASLRGAYTPTLGNVRLHVGANYQHRENTREALAQQYRARPLNQITDQRFIDTGNIASKGDDTVGLELAAIYKQFHFAAEGQKVWVHDALSAADILATNVDPDDNDTVPSGAVPLNGDPSFWSGYVELGFYLTGESRGYKSGRWDRTKVLHPFNQGGWGAFQVNGRIDYVDLSDRVDGSSSSVAAPFYVNGGRQTGYQLSLIWNPIDYVRFMAQYARIEVKGGPRASVAAPGVPGIFPIGTTTPANQRKYGVDTFGVRAQVDF